VPGIEDLGGGDELAKAVSDGLAGGPGGRAQDPRHPRRAGDVLGVVEEGGVAEAIESLLDLNARASYHAWSRVPSDR
jgi:hypothetical protein